jgi:hypothetical protein
MTLQGRLCSQSRSGLLIRVPRLPPLLLPLAIFCAITPLQAVDPFAALQPLHARVLKNWLRSHSQMRLGRGSDYDRQTLGYARKDFGSHFSPFYRAGDINHDGRQDFAVILVDNGHLAVAVFNGPLTAATTKECFFLNELETGTMILVMDGKWLIGPPESDSGFWLKPAGNTYRAVYR